MTRLLLTLLLAAEAALAAGIVALVGGWAPVPAGVVVWFVGLAVVVSLATAVVSPRAAGRVARHGALALVSAVFVLPLLWLLGTSFKQPEETFTDRPRLLPAVAVAPRASPWDDVRGRHAVQLGDVRLTDSTGAEQTLSPTWAAAGGAVIAPDGTFGYDFTHGDAAATGYATLADRTDLAAVTIRLRPDDSWHGLSLALELAGRRYESDDALYLGRDGWREWTFTLPTGETGRDERAMGVWPLAERGRPGEAAPSGPRLSLTIHRKTRAGATLARWTQTYRDAWYADANWRRYLFNSAYLVTLTVVGQVLSCSMAAYAFARLRWPGREVVFGLVLATMMLPAAVVMVPQFLIFKSLGWYNTLLPLWAPAFVATPFFIFLLRQFMLGLPRELEEAARIDGCSWWGVYWRVVLPVMKPALAAVAVLTFVGTWNEFMQPLIYLNDERLYPLSLGLHTFKGARRFDFNLLMAASALMTLPVVALFFLAQRYFIQGVTLTGMKA